MKTKFMQFIVSLWEGWGEVKQVVENQPETTPLAANPVAELVKSSPVSLTDRVNRFLQSAYDFRHNLLTEETEFRPAGKVGEGFSSVGKRELNTFALRPMHGELHVGTRISAVIFIPLVFLLIILSFFIWMNFLPGMEWIVLKRLPAVYLPIRCG